MPETSFPSSRGRRWLNRVLMASSLFLPAQGRFPTSSLTSCERKTPGAASSMKKLRIYIDTSVIGGCFDAEFSQWSNSLMKDFAAGTFIPLLSDVVALELGYKPLQISEYRTDHMGEWELDVRPAVCVGLFIIDWVSMVATPFPAGGGRGSRRCRASPDHHHGVAGIRRDPDSQGEDPGRPRAAQPEGAVLVACRGAPSLGVVRRPAVCPPPWVPPSKEVRQPFWESYSTFWPPCTFSASLPCSYRSI